MVGFFSGLSQIIFSMDSNLWILNSGLSFYTIQTLPVLMLLEDSEEEKLFQHLDQIEAEIEKLESLGLHDESLEQISKRLRKSLYSYRRLSSNTLLAVVRSKDEKLFSEWNSLWEQMKEGKLHPRDLKAFHDRLELSLRK
jgi:cell shape-determining protein MreC